MKSRSIRKDRQKSAPWCLTATLYLCLSLYNAASAQTEDSDCLYEFNKAFEISESGMQQMELAQQYVEQDHYKEASQHYQLAIDLLQQSIQQYTNLSALALDCSATNLSISKNNLDLARENLSWAKKSLGGLDCLKRVGELEALDNLASEYYYEHKDPASAERTINDALALSAQIQEQHICHGDYQELLLEQHRHTEKIATALKNRRKFDQCLNYIKIAQASEQSARKATLNKNLKQSKQKWREVVQHASKGLAEGVCESLYLKRLLNLKTYATRELNK